MMSRSLVEDEVSKSADHNATTSNANAPKSESSEITPNKELYRYTFFSPEAAPARKTLKHTLLSPLLYNSILMWVSLSLFFGSLLDNADVSKIKVTAANLDDGFVGAGIIDGIRGSLGGPGPHLKWRIEDSGSGWTDDNSQHLVVDEQTWAVLQVSPNSTTNLEQAITTGDSEYDPTSAITLYIASGRNHVTLGSVAIPAIQSLINPILARIAANSTASFLQAVAGDQNAVETALQCPQCLASPLAFRPVDLIPFTSSVAFGLMNTGIIFLLTFTFNMFVTLRQGAEANGHLLTLRTHLYMRTIASLGSYFFLSLMYTLIILAFSVPLTGHYSTRSAGFFVLWMLNFCTMGACGLVLESLCSYIGMKWAVYFLNIWLIANASSAFASFELMDDFYQYGYVLPFWHSIQGTRTIVFGTKNRLGMNFGVLIAWCVVGLAGVYVFTAWNIRRGSRKGVHIVP